MDSLYTHKHTHAHTHTHAGVSRPVPRCRYAHVCLHVHSLYMCVYVCVCTIHICPYLYSFSITTVRCSVSGLLNTLGSSSPVTPSHKSHTHTHTHTSHTLVTHAHASQACIITYQGQGRSWAVRRTVGRFGHSSPLYVSIACV